MSKDTQIGGVSYNTEHSLKLTEKEFIEQHAGTLSAAEAKTVHAEIKKQTAAAVKEEKPEEPK